MTTPEKPTKRDVVITAFGALGFYALGAVLPGGWAYVAIALAILWGLAAVAALWGVLSHRGR